MGARAVNWIVEIKAFQEFAELNQLSAGQRSLWHALMYVNNKCAWSEWFNVANIVLVSNTGLSRQGVIKARTELIRLGLLEFVDNSTNAGSYRLNICSTIMQESVQAGCGVVDKLVAEEFTSQLPSSLQVSIPLNKHKHKPKQNINNITPIVPYDDMFSKLWDAYPRHDSRKVAFNSFSKLKPTEEMLTDILNAVEIQKRSEAWQKENGKYIPMLSTYLNQERWKDEGIKDTRRIPQKGDKDWIPG